MSTYRNILGALSVTDRPEGQEAVLDAMTAVGGENTQFRFLMSMKPGQSFDQGTQRVLSLADEAGLEGEGTISAERFEDALKKALANSDTDLVVVNKEGDKDELLNYTRSDILFSSSKF